jgi:hypothetical protein
MPSRSEVYEAIESERDYQDSLRERGQFTEVVLPVAGELLIMKEYLDRAIRSYVENPGETPEETLNIIRKITTTGFRAMEHHGAPLRIA